jgi:hypothetical protein
MQFFRAFLALVSLACFAGWLSLRKPYSPSQDLPPVTITAFSANAPSSEAGQSLADAARGWQGVTASTYNPASDLLVLTHWTSVKEVDLQSGLQTLARQRIERKVFPEPAGAKCPVPQEALAALPGWLLGLGLLSALAFLLSSATGATRREAVPFSE